MLPRIRDFAMNNITAKLQIVSRLSGRSVWVAVAALLVGGLVMPGSAAFADIVDAEIYVVQSPIDLAINPAGTFAYVTNDFDETVSRINLATNTEDAKIDLHHAHPWKIAINPAGTFAYVTGASPNNAEIDTLFKIDLASNKVIGTFPLGFAPGELAINPAGAFAYFINGKSNSIARFDLASNRVDATIAVGHGPVDLAINPAGTFAYVANHGSGTLSKINLATNKVEATIKCGKSPLSFAINPAGTFAYVVNQTAGRTSDTVSKINLATNKMVATFQIGPYASVLVINPAGTFAYITSFESSSVFKIDLATSTMKAIIDVKEMPFRIAINPSGTFAYLVTKKYEPEEGLRDYAGSGIVYRINLGPGGSVRSSAPVVTARKSVSAKSLAAYAKLAVPNGATISLIVSGASIEYCKVSGSSLQGVKAGPCNVSVWVKPKTGKEGFKTVPLTVTK